MLALIEREFNFLLLAQSIRNDGGSSDAVAKALKIKPTIAGKYIAMSGRYSREYFMKALTDCVETERLIKQGLMKDITGLEMLIIKYAS